MEGFVGGFGGGEEAEGAGGAGVRDGFMKGWVGGLLVRGIARRRRGEVLFGGHFGGGGRLMREDATWRGFGGATEAQSFTNRDFDDCM